MEYFQAVCGGKRRDAYVGRRKCLQSQCAVVEGVAAVKEHGMKIRVGFRHVAAVGGTFLNFVRQEELVAGEPLAYGENLWHEMVGMAVGCNEIYGLACVGKTVDHSGGIFEIVKNQNRRRCFHKKTAVENVGDCHLCNCFHPI